jgi:uncharacterized protein YlzI (FlbEa/FlbD family)
MESGKVYVVHNDWIQDPETDEMPYKIGITKNSVNDRYYGLGLKMPGEFICDFAYEFGDNYAKVEKTLHSMLNQLNINGEWFNINEEALDGIKTVCDLAGGKLITKIVEEEIEEATDGRINPFLEKIINKWNETSDMEAVGRSPNWRSIRIPGINTGVHYQFRIRNSKEIIIELGCWTKMYPDIVNLFKEFDELNIKNNIFNYLPLTNKEIKYGWKGKIRTIMPLSDIDGIVEMMKILIEQTKDKIINECNRE